MSGANITRLRENAGITQTELAGLVGVSQSAISQWEGGETVPRTSILSKVADALHCTVDELLRGEA